MLRNYPDLESVIFAIVSEMHSRAISLGIGEPDFVTPWKIREASIFALEKGKTSYTDNRGLISLRKEISTYCSSFFGPDYDPISEILVTVGVSEAIDIALIGCFKSWRQGTLSRTMLCIIFSEC